MDEIYNPGDNLFIRIIVIALQAKLLACKFNVLPKIKFKKHVLISIKEKPCY